MLLCVWYWGIKIQLYIILSNNILLSIIYGCILYTEAPNCSMYALCTGAFYHLQRVLTIQTMFFHGFNSIWKLKPGNSATFLSLSFSPRALPAFLRGGWRIVGGRAVLRLIWENSQHWQMPCVISSRNGWILGQKEFRKVLPLSHNVQKQLDWDFMECANLNRESRLFGANKRNNCQCSRTPKTSGDPRIWRFIGGLAFLSAVRPLAGSFGQKMPACSKNRPWHPSPRSWEDDGEKVPDSRHLPFAY